MKVEGETLEEEGLKWGGEEMGRCEGRGEGRSIKPISMDSKKLVTL